LFVCFVAAVIVTLPAQSKQDSPGKLAVDVTSFLRTLRAINKRSAYIVLVWTTWGGLAEIQEVCGVEGVGNSQPFLWYKTDDTVLGHQGMYRDSVEVAMLMYVPNAAKVDNMLSVATSAVEKHNVVCMPVVRKPVTLSDGTRLCVGEKPTALYHLLLTHFVKIGETVMVLGEGSLAEVTACIMHGASVVVVDANAKKVEYINSCMITWDAQFADPEEKPKPSKKRRRKAQDGECAVCGVLEVESGIECCECFKTVCDEGCHAKGMCLLCVEAAASAAPAEPFTSLLPTGPAAALAEPEIAPKEPKNSEKTVPSSDDATA
jgi:hypothetical protein